MSARTGPDAWEGLLDPGEVIIWQGQPAPGIRLEWDSVFHPFFFLFFTGFSVFWMVIASQAPGPFWMFGLLFFGIGSYNLVGVHFWKAMKRRNTFYTLTNKRAFIGTNFAGKRSLESYPIAAETPLRFEEGNFANIWFGKQTHRTQKGRITTDVGFLRLAEGRDVYAKFRQIQRTDNEQN